MSLGLPMLLAASGDRKGGDGPKASNGDLPFVAPPLKVRAEGELPLGRVDLSLGLEILSGELDFPYSSA